MKIKINGKEIDKQEKPEVSDAAAYCVVALAAMAILWVLSW